MSRARLLVFFVFVYAEGPEVPPSAHGPGTSPIGSATTRDAKVNVPSAAVHMHIPNLPKVATSSCTLMDHPRHVCQRDDTHQGLMVKGVVQPTASKLLI